MRQPHRLRLEQAHSRVRGTCPQSRTRSHEYLPHVEPHVAYLPLRAAIILVQISLYFLRIIYNCFTNTRSTKIPTKSLNYQSIPLAPFSPFPSNSQSAYHSHLEPTARGKSCCKSALTPSQKPFIQKSKIPYPSFIKPWNREIPQS